MQKLNGCFEICRSSQVMWTSRNSSWPGALCQKADEFKKTSNACEQYFAKCSGMRFKKKNWHLEKTHPVVILFGGKVVI